MFTYALRCTENLYPTLIHLAKLLDVVDVVDGVVVEKNKGCWDHIGYKLDGDIPAEGEVDTRVPLADTNGNKYVHINVRTPIDVRAKAEALATTHPELGTALSQIPQYFITDADGNATLPEFPMRVFL